MYNTVYQQSDDNKTRRGKQRSIRFAVKETEFLPSSFSAYI